MQALWNSRLIFRKRAVGTAMLTVEAGTRGRVRPSSAAIRVLFGGDSAGPRQGVLLNRRESTVSRPGNPPTLGEASRHEGGRGSSDVRPESLSAGPTSVSTEPFIPMVRTLGREPSG